MSKNIYPRTILAVSLLLALSLAFIQPARAQAEPPQVRITQVDASRFPQVTVYVSVTNADGEPVNVDPGQIQLYENGLPVAAEQISGAGEVGPLITMLVMDVSGSMVNGGKIEAAKQAARAYIDRMRPGDQGGLISFDTQITYVQPVTEDRQALQAAVDGLAPRGDTAMYDALLQAVAALEGLPGRKAIILLTDGLDNSSAGTLGDVTASVSQGGLSISTIGLGDPAAGSGYYGIDETSLRDLADQAGGAYAFATDSTALQQIYQVYGQTLQSEYAITYTSPASLRDGINRTLTAALGSGEPAASDEAGYNPGGVLPEVAGSSNRLFLGILIGLIVLLFLPPIVRLFGQRRPKAKKSRIKLK